MLHARGRFPRRSAQRRAAGARSSISRGKAAGELGRRRPRATTGPSASTASSWTRRTSSGSAGTAAGPSRPAPGSGDDMILKFTMAGKLVMQIGHRGQSKGNTDTENVHQASRCLRGHAREGGLRGRRLRQPACGGVRRRHREIQADVGRLRQPAAADVRAESPAVPQPQQDGRRPAGVRPGARREGVERRHRLRGRPHQQPHPGVHDRRASICGRCGWPLPTT